jgi:NAD(P)-dependent dehydrogenase (short-subunit alcohol dehydrogenase family)
MERIASTAVVLEGQIAIVTGAARGIGLAIARRLAREGAGILVFDRDAEGAAQAAHELRVEGANATPQAVDVTVEEAVRGAVDGALSVHGRIDVLVNNAGIYPHTPFEELTFPEWRRVLATNLDSVFLCSHAVFPAMKARGYGRIVNISSAAFHVGEAGLTHYVASKGGVIGFTRALALAGGPHGIIVNAVTPGFIETPGVLDDPDELAIFDRIVAEQGVPRRGLPEDVAECVAYLASPAASFISGQTVNVDGAHRFI